MSLFYKNSLFRFLYCQQATGCHYSQRSSTGDDCSLAAGFSNHFAHWKNHASTIDKIHHNTCTRSLEQSTTTPSSITLLDARRCHLSNRSFSSPIAFEFNIIININSNININTNTNTTCQLLKTPKMLSKWLKQRKCKNGMFGTCTCTCTVYVYPHWDADDAAAFLSSFEKQFRRMPQDRSWICL